MNKLLSVWFLVLLMVNCTGQQISPPPEITLGPSIPLKVGVILSDTPATDYYGVDVVKELNEMKLFDSLVYPYNKATPVDAVLTLTISRVENIGADLARIVVGGMISGAGEDYDTLAVIKNSQYLVKTKFAAVSGFTATSDNKKRIQAIASELYKKIQADRQTLIGTK